MTTQPDNFTRINDEPPKSDALLTPLPAPGPAPQAEPGQPHPQPPYRVVLADDNAMVRTNLRALLEASGEVVVGVAANGREAVKLANEFGPDLVLLDMAMPEMNGIEATWQITLAHPQMRVIVFSVHTTSSHVQSAFRAGAWGYVAKEMVGQEMLTAIRTVRAGQRYISPKLAEQPAFPPLTPTEWPRATPDNVRLDATLSPLGKAPKP